MTRRTAVKDAQPDMLDMGAAPSGGHGRQAVAAPRGKTKKPSRAVAIAKPQPKVIGGSPAEMLRVIAEAAANPKVDANKMATLLDVQERIAKEQARRAFTAAKLALRPHLPIINKDGKIEIAAKDKPGGGRTAKQSTPYATFENIMDKIDKPLQDHGFDLFFTTEETTDGSRLIIVGHLCHVEGHTELTRFPLPAETSGSKNNVQGWMSSRSYGCRGCTIGILNLRTRAPEDVDRDGNAPPPNQRAGEVRTITPGDDDIIAPEVETVSQKQQDDLRDAIEACGVGTKKFCDHFKITKVSELPADKFKEAIDKCKNYNPAR